MLRKRKRFYLDFLSKIFLDRLKGSLIFIQGLKGLPERLEFIERVTLSQVRRSNFKKLPKKFHYGDLSTCSR